MSGDDRIYRPRREGMEWWEAIFIFVAAMIATFLLLTFYASGAYAHQWYSGLRNPETGVGCCGGNDCFEVPLEWLSEDNDNFIVSLPDPLPVAAGLSGTMAGKVYFFPKNEAMPAKGTDNRNEGKDGFFHSGYHACIWGGKARCFFFPTNT